MDLHKVAAVAVSVGFFGVTYLWNKRSEDSKLSADKSVYQQTGSNEETSTACVKTVSSENNGGVNSKASIDNVSTNRESDGHMLVGDSIASVDSASGTSDRVGHMLVDDSKQKYATLSSVSDRAELGSHSLKLCTTDTKIPISETERSSHSNEPENFNISHNSEHHKQEGYVHQLPVSSGLSNNLNTTTDHSQPSQYKLSVTKDTQLNSRQNVTKLNVNIPEQPLIQSQQMGDNLCQTPIKVNMKATKGDSGGDSLVTQMSITDATDICEDTSPLTPSDRFAYRVNPCSLEPDDVPRDISLADRNEFRVNPYSLEQDAQPLSPRNSSQDIDLHSRQHIQESSPILHHSSTQETFQLVHNTSTHETSPPIYNRSIQRTSSNIEGGESPNNLLTEASPTESQQHLTENLRQIHHPESGDKPSLTGANAVLGSSDVEVIYQRHGVNVGTTGSSGLARENQTEHGPVIITSRSEDDQVSTNRSVIDQISQRRSEGDPVSLTPTEGHQPSSSTSDHTSQSSSIPGADAEPYSGNTEERLETISDLENETDDPADGVILHAEDDRDGAIEFIRNIKQELPDLNMNLLIYEQLRSGRALLGSAAELFDTCRFLFIYVTPHFKKSDLERFQGEIALIESICNPAKNCRVIPVMAENGFNIPELMPLIPLKYNRYLEAKAKNKSDQSFLRAFQMLIKEGRKKYLVS